MLDLLRHAPGAGRCCLRCESAEQRLPRLEWATSCAKKYAQLLQEPNWGSAFTGPTAGRETAHSITNAFYAKESGTSSYSGCHAYEDFRELLAKEKDLDASCNQHA